MATHIYVKTQFEALHRWKDAPAKVSFLRNYHRHVFHVRVHFQVTHNDRDIEYFLFKERLDAYIQERFAGQLFDFSCEHIAEDILVRFRADIVDVSEDGENGSFVTRSTQSTQKKSGLFVGTELEGPNKGDRVLFVPASTHVEEFKAKWEQVRKAHDVKRVYFGAGNLRAGACGEGSEILIYLLSHLPSIPIDVEVSTATKAQSVIAWAEINAAEGKLGSVIAYGPTMEELRKVCDAVPHLYHKAIENDTVRWTKMDSGAVFDTWLHHPGFDRDIDV